MGKIIGLVVILIAGGIFFLSGKDKQIAQAPVAADVPVEISSEEPAQEIIVEANNWYFEPEEIRVKEGKKVKIVLRGVTGTHAFAIPELSVKSKEVKPGETTAVEFTADKKGEFSFKCSVFCGEGHSGMTGKFIVE